ncbi:hypothetical protein UFOVP70_42 [uncultured Caudovirales phage]|uniref:Uncharacterized protein n=1 Tax=uncultured Caudovirales phage TaxID=2100421 RepID=A0A6J5KUZ6_9CAUD|nr:hypothetical protein UFOVP70_42 [uncultured Caudovirales phage]
MSLTISGTTITFNDGSTLDSTSTFNAIGSHAIAVISTASNLLPNTTIAGSSCYYPTTITTWNSNLYTQGSGVTNPYTVYPNASTGQFTSNSVAQFSSGNIGVQPPAGHSALSGTWRILSFVKARAYAYYNCCGANTSYTTYGQALIVRVS